MVPVARVMGRRQAGPAKLGTAPTRSDGTTFAIGDAEGLRAPRDKEIPMVDQEMSTSQQTNIEETRPAPATTSGKRGFGSMDRTQVREMARRGGQAAHRSGKAHEFTSDEARAAGRKGGLATRDNRLQKSQ